MSIEKNKLTASPLTITQVLEGATAKPLFPVEHLIEYFGVVNYATNERVLESIKTHIKKHPGISPVLTVTSAGGPSGTAMSFYDMVRSVLRPNLITIGAGDVDSSGLLLFLAGERRYVSRHTTGLLHRAGRVFEGGKRITARELDSMKREDALKDGQYAAIVAERSHGRLTQKKVLRLMDSNVTLLPGDFVALGLADNILE